MKLITHCGKVKVVFNGWVTDVIQYTTNTNLRWCQVNIDTVGLVDGIVCVRVPGTYIPNNNKQYSNSNVLVKMYA